MSDSVQQTECEARRNDVWDAIEKLRDKQAADIQRLREKEIAELREQQVNIRLDMARLLAKWSGLIAAPGVILLVWKCLELFGR
jgi:hypothetical protein